MSNALTQMDFEFIDMGQGPVLLFLHGLFGHPSNWLPMMQALAGEYRVLALRYPFFEDKRLHGVEALTDYTLTFMDAHGIERASLCGNSLGGQIALDLCLKQPQRLEKLILAGSAGLWEAQPGGQLPRATRDFIRQQAQKIFHDPRHVDDELIEKLYAMLQDRMFARTLLRLARDTQSYTLDDKLRFIQQPTLLVWGENDRITPPEVAYVFKQKIPGSRLVFLPQCGHAPPLEQPQRFTEEIRSFLRECTDQA